MIRFYTDLDNTILYSYKHDIGPYKICVEHYQGRQVSYVTPKTHALLQQLNETISIVPTTTRTVEQYNRIHLPEFSPRHALVCNGGILLTDGKEDTEWYERSLKLVSVCKEALKYGERLLEQDNNRCFEVRNIKGLFIFTKSEKPFASVERLRANLDKEIVDIFSNGLKVYIVPKVLNKGTAVMRFQKKHPLDCVIAAGDSEFDIPMLNCADLGIAPVVLKGRHDIQEHVKYMTGQKLFSEELLTYILSWVKSGAVFSE